MELQPCCYCSSLHVLLSSLLLPFASLRVFNKGRQTTGKARDSQTSAISSKATRIGKSLSAICKAAVAAGIDATISPFAQNISDAVGAIQGANGVAVQVTTVGCLMWSRLQLA